MSPHKTGREWVIRIAERPFTINAERRMHHMQRAKLVREWRGKAEKFAKRMQIPRLEAVHVISQPYLTGRLQDADACHPAVKAVIDGVVDAGVLVDDAPRYVRAITYRAPIKASADRLEVTIVEILEETT